MKKIRGLLGGRILAFQLATIREAMTAYHTWERAATSLRQRPTLDPLIPPSPSRDVELGGDVGGETRVRCRRRGQKRGAIGEDVKRQHEQHADKTKAEPREERPPPRGRAHRFSQHLLPSRARCATSWYEGEEPRWRGVETRGPPTSAQAHQGGAGHGN